eukprot:comp21711_c0_seq8/m.48356 comp21711_c0_seq8/g.48356  ORF comp21711_c0_seq8/g.48356 comp21711_c0_seq8/m.48356 type:complete len:401 (+) comp21711_c0_seq8:594-1796(+)
MLDHVVVVDIAVKEAAEPTFGVALPDVSVARVDHKVGLDPIAAVASALGGHSADFLLRSKIDLNPLSRVVELRNPATPRAAAIETGVLRAVVEPVVAVRRRRLESIVGNGAGRETERLAAGPLFVGVGVELKTHARPGVGHVLGDDSDIPGHERALQGVGHDGVHVEVAVELLRAGTGLVRVRSEVLAIVGKLHLVDADPMHGVAALGCDGADRGDTTEIGLDPLSGTRVSGEPAVVVDVLAQTGANGAIVAPVATIDTGCSELRVENRSVLHTERAAKSLAHITDVDGGLLVDDGAGLEGRGVGKQHIGRCLHRLLASMHNLRVQLLHACSLLAQRNRVGEPRAFKHHILGGNECNKHQAHNRSAHALHFLLVVLFCTFLSSFFISFLLLLLFCVGVCL